MGSDAFKSRMQKRQKKNDVVITQRLGEVFFYILILKCNGKTISTVVKSMSKLAKIPISKFPSCIEAVISN